MIGEALNRAAPTTSDIMLARLLSWQAGDVKDLDDPTDYEDAMRAAAIYAASGDPFSEGKMLLRAGISLLSPNAPQKAGNLLQQSLALLRSFGRTKSLARCMSALASARLFAGDRAEASALHATAISIYGDLGEPN